jgi:hypothetical protein
MPATEAVAGRGCFSEASSAGFFDSAVYGVRVLSLFFWYLLDRAGLRRSRRFHRLPDRSDRPG